MPTKHPMGLALYGAMVAGLVSLAGTALGQSDLSAAAGASQMKSAMDGDAKDKDKDKLPSFDKVGEGFEKVVSTADGSEPLYTIWTREKDGQMLVEIPRNHEKQKLYIATTISGGVGAQSKIQMGEVYAYWKKFGDRMALIEPEMTTRSTGDNESQLSRDVQFTDRVILDVPIVAKGPGGGFVIDMDDLLVGKARDFFGGFAAGANTRLATIAKAKAFPENIEVAYTVPVGANGDRLTTFHYSISVLPERTNYTPREADARVGFFVTAFTDLAKVPEDSTFTRYINRWKLEKADPKLAMSPPKEPIVFYISDTTPIRYRRYVREGILEWNKAFEKVGIVNAVECYQQDARTGAHMDKDPEDRRYNFYVWNSNGAGFAIGPSRVDPRTGQILDADVVMNDGWIRFAASQWQRVIPEIAMENFGPATLAWLNQHPKWDPRIRMLPAVEREEAMRERMIELASGGQPYGGHDAANVNADFIGDDKFDGLAGRISQVNGYCTIANERGMDLTMVRSGLLPLLGENAGDDILDGAPEWFIGAVIKDVTMHEVGHTLGLRHNFKASTVWTMDEINSPERKGKPIAGSVMDYNAVNIQVGDLGAEQTDYFMTTIGPYDYWAIEYGYTSDDKKLKDILAKAGEREHLYATDEDTWGPDPTARRRDMGGDALSFEESMMDLVQDLRGEIIDRVMKDGDSWQKVRDAYGTTLGLQVRAISNAANWVGGSYLFRDRKGDAVERDPNVPVEAELQRNAVNFVIEHAFNDDAYGLTPDLLAKMNIDKWWGSMPQSLMFADAPFDVHDTILGVQAASMTMLLNPTTLKRVHDLEYRIPKGEDALTIPELLSTVTDAAWSELGNRADKRFTAREPMISSLRRNLQRENLDRLIDLTMPGGMTGAAARPIQSLAAHTLRELDGRIEGVLAKADSKIDPYTAAHLEEARLRIAKALDASYIYNTNDIGFGALGGIQFGQPANR